LDLLGNNQLSPAAVFKTVKTEDLRLLMNFKNESEENINSRLYPGLTEKAKVLASNILRKIGAKYPEKFHSSEGLEQFITEDKTVEKVTKYDLPCSLSALLFQLTETTSLERVTFLLQSLNHSASSEDLMKLRWAEKLKVVLDKYCEKLFTCDNLEVLKYGIFHSSFLSAVLKISRSSEDFVMILNLGFFEGFYVLLDEGIRLFYQLVIHKDENEENKLGGFICQSLKVVELVINPAYYKFLRMASEGLARVLKTISAFTHHNVEDLAMPAPEDPEELKLLSPEIFEFKAKIFNCVTKIEALLEYQERHEEKFARLFDNDE
jgi:hypothetical protein